MSVITNNCMRIIVFEDTNLGINLGVLENELEFYDITSILPEFPEKLQDIMALEDVKASLADALHYEDFVLPINSVCLKAPLSTERYLWFYAENDNKKGLYLQASRGIVGHDHPLRAPFGNGLNFIPHVVFMAGDIIAGASVQDTLMRLDAFTLLTLGIAATGDLTWRGLASQYEGCSAAGPWVMLCRNCHSFFGGKTLEVERNRRHLATIKLDGIALKAAEVMSKISETLTIMPGDMLALPVYPAFEANVGDSVNLRISGFGTLSNTIGMEL